MNAQNYKRGQIQHDRHINDIYKKDTCIVAEKRFIGNFYHVLEKDLLHTIFIRSTHSFLYSFSYLTIKKYPISQLFSRMNNYSPFFFQKLLIDYDKYNLHHKYNYRAKIDKLELKKELFENRTTDNVIQFIIDYFDISLIVNDMNDGRIVRYFSRGIFDVYKPMILMYKNKERYYPLFFHKRMENNKLDRKYILKSSDKFKWKMYMNYIQPNIIKFRFPSKLNVKLYALKIKELRALAAEYDIPTDKVSDNKKKIVSKTKEEIKIDIRKKLGLTI